MTPWSPEWVPWTSTTIKVAILKFWSSLRQYLLMESFHSQYSSLRFFCCALSFSCSKEWFPKIGLKLQNGSNSQSPPVIQNLTSSQKLHSRIQDKPSLAKSGRQTQLHRPCWIDTWLVQALALLTCTAVDFIILHLHYVLTFMHTFWMSFQYLLTSHKHPKRKNTITT